MTGLAGVMGDRRWRALFWQALLLGLLAWGIAELTSNAIANLQRQNIASGFGFLSRTAGFDISQRLISYVNTDSYWRAFQVGLCNTLLVAGIGCVLAAVLGFLLGIARLSTNWLVSALALGYVEIVRNVPPLLWLFAVYFGVLLKLPPVGESLLLPFGATLNQRGLFLTLPVMTPAWQAVLLLAAGGVAAGVLLTFSRRRARAAGDVPSSALLHWAMVLAPATVVALLTGAPQFDAPKLGRFNFEGGGAIEPEFLALLIALVTYTAAYIGEIVRAGIQGVSDGQRQAAAALGLPERESLRYVVVPQALRTIIPPLTNQFVNLTKNSSLAVAVGYPDLVSILAGTILNHTNQAVETITITMAVYLTLSLSIAAVMNTLNARVALKER